MIEDVREYVLGGRGLGYESTASGSPSRCRLRRLVHPYDWIIGGLALDLAGAILLAKGFMLKRPANILREARTLLGRNSFLVKSGLYQKAEAWVGGSFLVFGFLAQLWGNFHGAPAANDLGLIGTAEAMVGLCILVAGLAWGCLSLAHRWARETFRRHFFGAVDPTKEMPPLSGDDWDGLAWLYDTKRQAEETDDDLRERLEQLRRELGLRYSLAAKRN